MLNNTTSVILDPFYMDVYEWSKHATSIFLSVSFLLGLPGNILVVTVHCHIKGKTVTDWMIFYIAICDIISLVNAPLYYLQFEGIWALGFPNILCKLHYFNVNSIAMASYVCCACTALERYYKVVHSKEVFSITQAKYMWIPIFPVCFGLGSLSLFAVNNNGNGNCMYDMEVRFLSTINYIVMLFIAILSSIVMTFCYIGTGVFLLKKVRETIKYGPSTSFKKSHRNTIQTTKILATVTIVFLFSANVPYVIGVLFSSNRPTTEPMMTIMLVLAVMFFINNFINPFLYMAMSGIFRQRTKKLFQKCCCCCSDNSRSRNGRQTETSSNVMCITY